MCVDRRDLRPLWWLSVAVLVLMAVSSAAGLWWRGLYREPAELRAVLRAYDLVTLAAVVPLLGGVVVAGKRRAGPAVALLWAGCLIYAVYHYTALSFGLTFNDLFLVHVFLVPLSIAALVLLLANLDTDGIRRRFSPRTPARSVSVLLLLLAVALGGVWTWSAARYAVTGEQPGESDLVLPPRSVHLAYALDLGLLTPALLLGAVLLWRRAPWGYVLAPALLVYLLLYQANYTAALVFQADADIAHAKRVDPAEPFITAALLAAAVAMFAGLRRPRTS
ncbi:hypothetical protein ACFW7K_31105 [Streptomyces sp. NPDC058735]|uniref:hypothetical protein n=1 Tax=unclassified Streptomyces TaxID=2593676 RepID=UPI00369F71B2